VITIDTNLLVYAYNTTSPEHDAARRWLGETLSSNERVRLAWSTVHAFLRLTTNPRLFAPAFTPDTAAAVVDNWLRRDNVDILAPGPRYWEILRELIVRFEVRRDLVMDAHLAAMAMEHDVTVYTADSDFRRFERLRVVNPLSS
jgi:toxin-antitoxin system PIN domain toxin